MGSLWASLLTLAGEPVTLVLRAGSYPAQYSGICLESVHGQTLNVPVPLIEAEKTSEIRHLIICTKAFNTVDAVASVRHAFTPDCEIVMLQNGMGQQQVISELLPDANIYCALSTEGSWLRSRFHVVHAGEGKTLIGAFSDKATLAGAHTIAAVMSGAAQTDANANIREPLWEKLAINCAINGLSALNNCRNGDLVSDKQLNVRFRALCAELETVFSALGHAAIAAAIPARAAEVALATAANRSSMLQDFSAGRRTEIDYINGFLVDEADRAGIPCPLNRALVRELKERGG